MDQLAAYDFLLPKELIASVPLADRTASRLLCLRNGHEFPHHDYFSNIHRYLRAGDVLVLNNTRVRKAKISAFKASGGHVEILLVRPLEHGSWTALLDGKGPFLPHTRLHLGSPLGRDFITVLGKLSEKPNVYQIEASTDLGQYAEQNGKMPVPHYFKRRGNDDDEERYQTVFAKELGAVAAPTAGLHFTHELLSNLKTQGILVVETTLHVGPGTFLPIKSELLSAHQMHSEYFCMDEESAHILNEAKASGRRIIPVGSTAMRVLEQVMQWAHAENRHQFFACSGETSIFIRPGYKFLASNAIITNFHLPKSTLLVLVAAIYGRERILSAYQEAINQNYRFFSYGDACFIEVWNQS